MCDGDLIQCVWVIGCDEIVYMVQVFNDLIDSFQQVMCQVVGVVVLVSVLVEELVGVLIRVVENLMVQVGVVGEVLMMMEQMSLGIVLIFSYVESLCSFVEVSLCGVWDGYLVFLYLLEKIDSVCYVFFVICGLVGDFVESIMVIIISIIQVKELFV